MARFDIYANPGGAGYVLDVQADLLDGLNTRIVVPLLTREAAPTPARRLNPVLDVAGVPHVMVTQFMAAVPLSALRGPVGNLGEYHDDITAALDMAFVGF